MLYLVWIDRDRTTLLYLRRRYGGLSLLYLPRVDRFGHALHLRRRHMRMALSELVRVG